MEMVLPPSCRLSDWRHRLGLYLAAARGRPFAYGRHDCATFASGAVAALTGTDPIAALGIRYTKLRGGRRALLARGYADSIAFLRALLPEIPVVRAGLGEAVLVGRTFGVHAQDAAAGPIPSLEQEEVQVGPK